jgi:hypothetical protein
MRLGVFLLVLVFVAMPAFAYDLTFFAGWTNVGSWKTAALAVDMHDFGVLGIRHEKGWGPIGFESGFAYYSQPVAPTQYQGGRGIGCTGNLVVNIPVFKPEPFLTVGLGVMHKFGKSVPDIGTQFISNYGFGVKMRKLEG